MLKHFDWPEGKADAMREAAFEYQDLTKLLGEVSKFEDKSEMPCDKALKKMLTLLEKLVSLLDCSYSCMPRICWILIACILLNIC